MRAVVVLLSLALAFDACAEESAPEWSVLGRESPPLDALSRRHAQLRRRLERRGYGETIGLVRRFVLEGRGIALPLDLEVGACGTFVALGGGGIRELAVTLYDGEGREVAASDVPGEGALVHVCPEGLPGARRPHHLVVRSMEGTGAFMLSHFSTASVVGGDGFDGLFDRVLAPRAPLREVEEHLARARAALRGRGFSPVGPPLLDHIAEGSALRVSVPLEAERCYVALARGGEGVVDLDIFAFDGAGVEVARDLGTDPEPSLEHCPERAGLHTFELRAFEGSGPVGMLVFSAPDDGGGEAVEHAPDERTTERADPALTLGVSTAPLVARGFGAPIFVSRDAQINPGEVRYHEVIIGPGCGLVAGVGSHDGMDLDLYLADTEGREEDRDTGVHATPRVRACRDRATVFRVAVKAYGREGTYALASLRAPADIDALQAMRLEEVSAPLRARAYTQVSSFELVLSAGARAERRLTLQAGRCLAIAAAGDDGVEDVDLFLYDEADELLASESGPAPHASVVRCAEELERIRLEVGMYRGSGGVRVALFEGDP